VPTTPYSRRILFGILLPIVFAAAVAAILQTGAAADLSAGMHFALPLLAGVIAALPVYRWIRAPIRQLGEEARGLLQAEISSSNDEIASLRRSLTELSQRADRQVEALEAEREHLLAIVSSMSEGVLVVDREGRAVIVNPRWSELFGLPANMEGATPIELTRQTRLEQLVKRTLETGVGDQEEIDLDLPRARTIIVTSSALSDRSGAVMVARDITEFLRLAEIRRDFVANVSHELKTPLSAIRGLAETLKDGALSDPDAGEQFVDRILQQCKRLGAILSDLLTLSRLEHPDAPSRLVPIDVPKVAREAAEILAATAKKRGIALSVHLQEIRPLSGNHDAIERLVLNLLENAIKYNRKGGSVDLRVGQNGDEIVLEVADTGIGIPSESVDRLFERFYRVDKGRSRQEGGTGLGLAIVKHATNLHDGRIEVESQLGRGTTFRVFLPSAPAPHLEKKSLEPAP
jgi:two-component system phosphate regulon sensor histidine kinase PhoR